jgi:hypothetical protein
MFVLTHVAIQALATRFTPPHYRLQVFVGTGTPMAEQIDAFGDASVVVAAHGAALANMIFMR